MAYERTTWVPKNTDGSVPEGAPAINAQKLNNIEDGIEEALLGVKNLKIESEEYADNNTIYFSETVTIKPQQWMDVLQLPNGIEYTKYLPLIQTTRVTNYHYLRTVPYDTEVTWYYEFGRSIKLIISSNTGIVSFYDSDGSKPVSFQIDIILLPVNKRTMTLLTK